MTIKIKGKEYTLKSSFRSYMIYENITGKSFESIAEYFNKKHPTMLYSYEQVKGDLKTDKELDKAIIELKRKIKG